MYIYTIYCTTEQTKKALELGAKIEESIDYNTDGHLITTGYMLNGEVNDKNLDGFGWANTLRVPTAEQMIGWLEDLGLFVTTDKSDGGHFFYKIRKENTYICEWNSFNSRPEATLAGIDAALDYLITNKK